MDAFRRERIFTPNKRKQLYLLLSKAHQETGIMTAGASSKSGVFTIQLKCSIYGPEFEGWQLPKWRAKPVSLRVESAPRRKQTRFTSVTALKHKLP